MQAAALPARKRSSERTRVYPELPTADAEWCQCPYDPLMQAESSTDLSQSQAYMMLASTLVVSQYAQRTLRRCAEDVQRAHRETTRHGHKDQHKDQHKADVEGVVARLGGAAAVHVAPAPEVGHLAAFHAPNAAPVGDAVVLQALQQDGQVPVAHIVAHDHICVQLVQPHEQVGQQRAL